MDRLILIPESLTDSSTTEIAELRQLVTQLASAVATLRRENLALRQQAGYYQHLHARARERIDKLQLENQELRGHLRQRHDQPFGTSSEKQSKSERSNSLEGFDENEPDPDEPRKTRVTPKRRNFAHLPAKPEVIELPVEQPNCPQCGQPRQEMTDTEDSEQIEIEVKAYRRVIHRKRYRPTCDCPGCQTVTAPVPPQLLPKSLLGTSVWVEMLLAKYFSPQPIEWLLRAWKLMGFGLPHDLTTDSNRVPFPWARGA